MRSSAVIFLCSQQLRKLAKGAEKGLEEEGLAGQWALHAPPRLPAWPRVGEVWRGELLPRFLPVWHSLPSVFSLTLLTAAASPHTRRPRTPSESGAAWRLLLAVLARAGCRGPRAGLWRRGAVLAEDWRRPDPWPASQGAVPPRDRSGYLPGARRTGGA